LFPIILIVCKLKFASRIAVDGHVESVHEQWVHFVRHSDGIVVQPLVA